MSIMNIKEGADLTHPKPTAGWITGAIIAMMALIAVYSIASWMYRKGKNAVSGTATSTAGNLESQATQNGWL